jgi:hypothetical protein
MLVRLNLSIDDDQWPKLHIAGERMDSRGGRVAFDDRMQYDLAYTRFENTLHNQLRPLVAELIERKLGPQPPISTQDQPSGD